MTIIPPANDDAPYWQVGLWDEGLMSIDKATEPKHEHGQPKAQNKYRYWNEAVAHR